MIAKKCYKLYDLCHGWRDEVMYLVENIEIKLNIVHFEYPERYHGKNNEGQDENNQC